MLVFTKKAIEVANVPLTHYDRDEDGEPLLNNEVIIFNGVDEDGHESFRLVFGNSGFNFCKTARKPYDVLVVACLIKAEELGLIEKFRSDGDSADLKDGQVLYHDVEVFGGVRLVTFGFDHKHTIGDHKIFDHQCVARVKGNRDTVFELFGRNFCFEYPEDRFNQDLSRYPRGIIDAN